MKGLTDKQQTVLDYINSFSEQEGMAPTIYEISEHFSVKPATAFAHVRALQRKGYVNRSSKARSLTLTHQNKPRLFSLSLSIPILGRISAGVPTLAEENIERHIIIDPSLIPHKVSGQELFGLVVQGESMRDVGILDGDVIIAQRTERVGIGDVVVALADGECTVKSLFLTDGQWELRPANPDFSSRFFALDNLQVQGVVVALQRRF